ncbi:MAG: hypothetical protein LBG76_07285 [Treponema sp.]|jgi:hypothetical protein|nr:hypothetical protein [Treponema sp.]
MIQFYLLSILFNASAGYVLIQGDEISEEGSLETSFRFSPRNEIFRLVLGILSVVMGLLKLLSSTQGDLPVIGDLFPAAAGFAAGSVLILDYYRSRALLDPEDSGNAGSIFLKNKRLIGFFSLAAAALHFLFPTVLLL